MKLDYVRPCKADEQTWNLGGKLSFAPCVNLDPVWTSWPGLHSMIVFTWIQTWIKEREKQIWDLQPPEQEESRKTGKCLLANATLEQQAVEFFDFCGWSKVRIFFWREGICVHEQFDGNVDNDSKCIDSQQSCTKK